MELLKIHTPLRYADHCFGTKEKTTGNAVETVRKYTEIVGPIAHMRQVHSNRIAYAQEQGMVEEVDAIFTDRPDLWVAVKTADCVPVLLSCQHAVAAVHCGWRGLNSEILPKMIDLLSDEYKISSADIFMHIGPCIRRANYEVKEEIMQGFEQRFFAPASKKGKVLMDLAGIARYQAMECGLSDLNIVDGGWNTFTDNRFNSYRRDRKKAGDSYAVQLSMVKRSRG